jgi:hypothetical protein
MCISVCVRMYLCTYARRVERARPLASWFDQRLIDLIDWLITRSRVRTCVGVYKTKLLTHSIAPAYTQSDGRTATATATADGDAESNSAWRKDRDAYILI